MEPERRVFAGIAHELHGEAWGAPEEALSAGEPKRAVPLKLKRLPLNLKQFIVMQNASGASPCEVVARVREAWGISVTPQRVEAYDPTKATGAALGAELKELFRHVQREHQYVIMRAGIADQKWRLVMLHQIVVKAYEKGAFKIALQALEQAARECGGAYTNKTKVEVDDKRALLRLRRSRGSTGSGPATSPTFPRLRAGAQRWLYLAVVVNLKSRRVVGWSMAETLKTSLVSEALSMALARRSEVGHSEQSEQSGLFHSDRGSQYASEAYQKQLEAAGLVCSMSRKGDYWDNAPGAQ